MGHEVDVYEAKKSFGGMMRYGIPAYRFPRERLDEDVEAILSAGAVNAHLDTRVDADAMEALSKSHDAVYVAIGADEGKSLDIEGPNPEASPRPSICSGSIGEATTPISRERKSSSSEAATSRWTAPHLDASRRRRGLVSSTAAASRT